MSATQNSLVSKLDKSHLLRERLCREPNNAEALHGLGQYHASKNETGRALSYLCQAVAADQRNPSYYCALGTLLHRNGKNVEATCSFRQALSLDKQFTEAYYGLGKALHALGDLDLAVACLQTAVQYSKRQTDEYLVQLAFALLERQEYEKANEAARKAHLLNDKCAGAYVCLIESCLARNQFNQAMRWAQKCLRRLPKWSESFYNLARILQAQNRLDAAMSFYRKTISLNPDHSDAHLGLAACLLASGDFNSGWKEYEWRFRVRSWKQSIAAGFVEELTEPMWAGQNLEGKTLLVYGEQGFGDTLQLIRYISILAERGCRIILMVYQELVKLLHNVRLVSAVIAYGDLIPRYDYHVPLFSLPKMLNASIETIPRNIPYISSPNHRKAPSILGEPAALRVGFLSSTKRLSATDHRNMQLNDLEPLFRCRSIRFYNLQINDQAGQLEVSAKYSNVHSLKPFIRDWQDTAFFVSKMDLVLSIDSGIAHLAGALGMPVWVMLCYAAEWRWLKVDKHSPWFHKSPWYPTMRLFRASSFDSWKPVIEQIRNELTKRIARLDVISRTKER